MATQAITKETIIKLLAEEDTQVLSVAYLYAKNMTAHGIDVTKQWETAVKQDAALYRAEMDGYARARREFYEFIFGNKEGDGE